MKSTLRGLALGLPLLAFQAVLPTFLADSSFTNLPGVAHAQEEGEQKEERETRRTQAMNNKTFEQLSKAQEMAEAKDYAGAMGVINDLKNGRKPLNDAESANVLNLEAYICYVQENYSCAINAYQTITGLEQAPEGAKMQAQYSTAQLYFVTEQWQQGVNALLQWFEDKANANPPQEPGANAHVLLSQGYYQLKDYDLSLKHVNIAVDDFKAKGKIPKENWYSLQRFLYYEQDNYTKVVEILEELLTYYPKKEYWLQLSAMWAELKNESKQLAAMDTAFVQGMLTKEKELVNMAYLYLANDVPWNAAKVLSQGVDDETIEPTSKNLELEGTSWRAAQEVQKAIPVLEQAAKKSDKGELWVRLGNLYLDNDEYQKAVNAISSGLKKGGVKRPDSANLVLGMAYFNLKKYDSARDAFNQAMKDERSEKYAQQWIQYMDNELARQRSLEQV